MNILKVLPESRYRPIVDYLCQKGITSTEDAIEHELDNLYFVPGMQLDDVMTAIAKIQGGDSEGECGDFDGVENNSLDSDVNTSATLHENAEMPESIRENIGESQSIESAFSDCQGYELFEQYCIANGIGYVSELCESDFHPANFENASESIRMGLLKRYESLYRVWADAHFVEKEQEVRVLPFDADSVIDQTQKRCFKKEHIQELDNLRRAVISFHKNEPNADDELKKALAVLYVRTLHRVITRAFQLRVNGETLEECGKAIGCTRERIRQQVEKACQKLVPVTSALVQTVSDGAAFCYVDDLRDILKEVGEDDFPAQAVVLIYRQKNSPFSYFPFMDAILLKQGQTVQMTCDKIHDVLQQYADESFTTIALDDQWEVIQDELERKELGFIGYQEVLSYLYSLKFKNVGGLLFRISGSYGRVVGQLVKVHFPNGINTSDPVQMQMLRERISELLPRIELPNDRAIVARIADDPQVVLAGRSTYINVASVKCDLHVLEEIVEFIDESDKEQFLFNDLYTFFEAELQEKSNIDNAAFLHGMLKYYFPDEYDYSRDSLVKHGGTRKNLSQQLHEVLLPYKNGLSLDELKKEFPSLTPLSTASALQFHPNIVYWGTRRYIAREHLILPDIKRQKLFEVLLNLCKKNDGYTSSFLLYGELIRKDPAILSDVGADSPECAFSLAQVNCSNEFKFSAPNIAIPDFCDGACTVRAILTKSATADGILDMDECRGIAARMHWSEQTVDVNLFDLHNDYIRIGKTHYAEPERFFVDDEDTARIESHLAARIEQTGYISIQDLHDYSGLPQLEFAWNPALLYGVTTHYCKRFNVVAPRNTSRSSFRYYIVLKESGIVNYEQLVKAVMIREQCSHIPEYEMLEFLAQRGLALQVIPYELYSGSEIRFEHDAFTI